MKNRQSANVKIKRTKPLDPPNQLTLGFDWTDDERHVAQMLRVATGRKVRRKFPHLIP